MKRIKDIACISRPSANIRIKPAIMLLERYCFLNIQRTVDGHGTVQTLEVKLISFAIWAAFYLGVLAIEWLIYVIVRRSKKQN